MKTIYVNENQIKETINQVEINIDNINKEIGRAHV